MIKCPHCGSMRLRVLGSAHNAEDGNYYRRHRKCKACGKNFHTREYVEDDIMPATIDDIRIALSFIARAQSYLRRAALTKSRDNNHIDKSHGENL